MRRIAGAGLVALTLVSGCSFMHKREPITKASQSPRCTSFRPALDIAAGTGLLLPGALLTAGGIADGEADTGLIGGALLVGSLIFYASSRHGMRESERCESEAFTLYAAESSQIEEPQPAPVAMTCEQRRLDMYSRAITGANTEQRKRLLTQLPSCSESQPRERAWALTRMATLDAGAGNCDGVEDVARLVLELDVALHDVVLMSDIEVKWCLQRREL